jgi:hypothetical protein
MVRATSTGAFGAGAYSVDIGLLVSQYVGFCHGHDDLAAQAAPDRETNREGAHDRT